MYLETNQEVQNNATPVTVQPVQTALKEFPLLLSSPSPDRWRRCGSHNWSPGANYPPAHDPSGWQTAPLRVLRYLWTPGSLEHEKPR